MNAPPSPPAEAAVPAETPAVPRRLSLPTQHGTTRMGGVDALRGIAAFWVVLFHHTVRYGHHYGYGDNPPFKIDGGDYAVHLFFIISGFVILMTAQRVSGPADFLLSRALRLYPSYWVCLILSFLMITLLGLPGFSTSIPRLLANFSMLQFLVGIGNIDPVYWSLQVEICFYAWVAVLIAAKSLHRIHLLFGALMVVGVAWHVVKPEYFQLTDADPFLPAHIQLIQRVLLTNFVHLFAAGTALFDLRNGRRKRGALMLVASAIYAAIVVLPTAAIIAGILLGVVAFAVFVPTRVLANPVLLFLGTISYPLYLIHLTFGWPLIRRALAAGLSIQVAIVIVTALTLALAAAITYGVERPALARAKVIKKRLLQPVAKQPVVKPAV